MILLSHTGFITSPFFSPFLKLWNLSKEWTGEAKEKEIQSKQFYVLLRERLTGRTEAREQEYQK